MPYTTGSLVKTRGREWVVLPETTDGWLTSHTPERLPKIVLTRATSSRILYSDAGLKYIPRM